jgi:hypothetical protein
MYDLWKDPLEKVNLAEVLPEVTHDMEKKINEWERTHTPRYHTPAEKQIEHIPKDGVNSLKSLGYIQ